MFQNKEIQHNQTLVIKSFNIQKGIDSLANNPPLTTLQLHAYGHMLDVDSDLIILNFLKSTHTLSYLDIDLYLGEPETIARIGQAILENTSLIKICITMNMIQYKPIMDAIIKNQQITSVIINGFNIYEIPYSKLGQYMDINIARLIYEKNNLKNLEILSRNRDFRCQNIANALAINTSLLELKLTETELNPSEMCLITNALSKNKNLQKLVTATSILNIDIDALQANTSLIEFGYNIYNPYNDITEDLVNYQNELNKLIRKKSIRNIDELDADAEITELHQNLQSTRPELIEVDNKRQQLRTILARNRIITPAYMWMMIKIGMADKGSLLYGNIFPEILNNIFNLFINHSGATKLTEALTTIKNEKLSDSTYIIRDEFSIIEPVKPYPDSFWKPCHTVSNVLLLQLHIKKMFAAEVHQVQFNWHTGLTFSCDAIKNADFSTMLGNCNASLSRENKKYVIHIHTKENMLQFFNALSLNREQCPKLYINYPLESQELDKKEKCSIQ